MSDDEQTEFDEQTESDWESMGAASAVVATVFFVVAFIIFLSTSPGGGNTPRLPDLANAEAVPAFIANNLQSIRAQVMLNTIGLVAFLWFLGTLWVTCRREEGPHGRGSILTLIGGAVGVAVTMVGLLLLGAATLTTTSLQADTVPALYAASSLAYAFGGGAFCVFFLGTAEVSFRSGGLPRWLGSLGVAAAVISAFGFVTPYYTSGIFNAATGGLGFYGHYAAFVVWLAAASVHLVLAQRRRLGSIEVDEPASETTEPEGASA